MPGLLIKAGMTKHPAAMTFPDLSDIGESRCGHESRYPLKAANANFSIVESGLRFAAKA